MSAEMELVVDAGGDVRCEGLAAADVVAERTSRLTRSTHGVSRPASVEVELPASCRACGWLCESEWSKPSPKALTSPSQDRALS